MRAHITRIKQINPQVNAVVKERFEHALAEARHKDEMRKSSAAILPEFHGVPCTIKECIQVAGMPNASGLKSRADVVSAVDAPTVSRLKEARCSICTFLCLSLSYTRSLTFLNTSNNP